MKRTDIHNLRNVGITQAQLRGIMVYTPENGEFERKEGRRRFKVGTCLPDNKGVKVKVGGRYHMLHRLAFLYMDGIIPTKIKHIDGNKSNNEWRNLEPRGYQGCVWLAKERKWLVTRGGKIIGLFGNKRIAFGVARRVAVVD